MNQIIDFTPSPQPFFLPSARLSCAEQDGVPLGLAPNLRHRLLWIMVGSMIQAAHIYRLMLTVVVIDTTGTS